MLKFLFGILGLIVISLSFEFISYFIYLIFFGLGWLFMYNRNLVRISFLGSDTLSWFIIILTFWIIILMLLASHGYKLSNFFYQKFCFVLILILVLLFLTFSSIDLLSFYIFFEGSLIPIYLLIVGWGYQPERLQAGIYLLLYTIFASLPLLISIFFIGKILGGFSFGLLNLGFSDGIWVSFWFFFSIFAFLVKLPAFYVHLWLPKAHVEAPVAGSIILAGVLLKLGCYGIIRLISFFQGKVAFLRRVLVSLGLLGGLAVSLICLRQVDLKALIAYSSVSHIGLALGGLGRWGLWGYRSCLYTCVAHGLCSSGLFFLSGVIYERTGSRRILINKGILEIIPRIAFWWFIYCIGNMAAPVVLNLVGELGLLGRILRFRFFSLVLLILFSFIGACYSLYLFSSIQHGAYYSGLRSLFDGLTREYLILFLHFFPLFFLILEVDFITYCLNSLIKNLSLWYLRCKGLLWTMFVLRIWNLIFIGFFTFSFLLFFLRILFLNLSFRLYFRWRIFSWGSTDINIIFLLDWVSLIFLSFVLFISGRVFYYSGEYIEGEINLSRFIFLLAGFVGSIGLLIFSPNLIRILLGWDGLGLVSYCLVIYYQNYKSLNAGTLTVLSNRVGDVLILLGIVWIINFGDWSFVAWLGNSQRLYLVSALIVLASLTKRAQIPFSAWLPAAIAAPTPVSSLVHSSTLVTAGIYLVIRLGWVYDFWINELLIILSVLTIFIAGLGACFEFDLKKIIALSTLSQLGLIIYRLSLGLVKVALFHLLIHALFKALLFIRAGCIIHGFKGWQDIRIIGNIMVSLPFISSCFVVSNLALRGIPFLAGFYSKDLILELSLIEELNLLSLFILFLSTGLTVAYTFRLIYYIVRRDFVLRGSCNLSDGWGVIIKSCIGLVTFSVFFGALISWLAIDVTSIILPRRIKNLTLFVCIIGIILGFFISQSSYNFSKFKFSLIVWFRGSIWFLPYVSSQPMTYIPLKLGFDIIKYGDIGWLEFLGGQGLRTYISSLSIKIQSFSINSLKVFILIIWIVVRILMFLY